MQNNLQANVTIQQMSAQSSKRQSSADSCAHIAYSRRHFVGAHSPIHCTHATTYNSIYVCACMFVCFV